MLLRTSRLVLWRARLLNVRRRPWVVTRGTPAALHAAVSTRRNGEPRTDRTRCRGRSLPPPPLVDGFLECSRLVAIEVLGVSVRLRRSQHWQRGEDEAGENEWRADRLVVRVAQHRLFNRYRAQCFACERLDLFGGPRLHHSHSGCVAMTRANSPACHDGLCSRGPLGSLSSSQSNASASVHSIQPSAMISAARNSMPTAIVESVAGPMGSQAPQSTQRNCSTSTGWPSSIGA